MRTIISALVILILANSTVLAITRQPVNLRSSITAPSTVLDPDESFKVRLAISNPLEATDNGVSAFNVFSHYIYPTELDLVDVGIDTCAKLPALNQLVCALYTLRDGQSKPSSSVNFNGRPSFKLKDPQAFCSGVSARKNLNLGLLSMNSQGQKDFNIANGTTVTFDCNLLDRTSSNSVDLNVRYLVQPPENINSYDNFSIKVQARNIDAAASPIYATNVTLNYPNVIEHVPGLSPNDNCIASGTNQLTCNYATVNTAKTKEINFRLKDTHPCGNLVGTYAFRSSAISNASGSQIRTELNPSNNTNINSNNITVGCQNIPDVRFLLVTPSDIALTNDGSGVGVGDPGKYSGSLRYRVEISNPSNENLTIGDVFLSLSNGTGNQLRNKVQLDNTAQNDCIGNDTAGRESRITCSFNPIAPRTKVSKEFTLKVINPNPFSDRAPFDPLGICTNRVELSSVSVSNIPKLDILKGWTDGSNGDGLFQINLDSSRLQGLDCINQEFRP